MLDVETEGSASLLSVSAFRDPEAYSLRVKKPGSDEVVERPVDLVETFNWLIGLHVELLDRPRTFTAGFERESDPELPDDQHTRLKVQGRLQETEDWKTSADGLPPSVWWFRTVEGYVRRTPGSDEDRENVLVIWRKLSDDPERDAAVLQALLDKLKVSSADTEFDTIYVNGTHGLRLPGDAKARLLSLEETFLARMWDTEDR